jgi:hypothetical protein
VSLIYEAATGGNLCPAPTPALLILPQRRLPLAMAVMKLYNDFTELLVCKPFGQERTAGSGVRIRGQQAFSGG